MSKYILFLTKTNNFVTTEIQNIYVNIFMILSFHSTCLIFISGFSCIPTAFGILIIMKSSRLGAICCHDFNFKKTCFKYRANIEEIVNKIILI